MIEQGFYSLVAVRFRQYRTIQENYKEAKDINPQASTKKDGAVSFEGSLTRRGIARPTS